MLCVCHTSSCERDDIIRYENSLVLLCKNMHSINSVFSMSITSSLSETFTFSQHILPILYNLLRSKKNPPNTFKNYFEEKCLYCKSYSTLSLVSNVKGKPWMESDWELYSANKSLAGKRKKGREHNWLIFIKKPPSKNLNGPAVRSCTRAQSHTGWSCKGYRAAW